MKTIKIIAVVIVVIAVLIVLLRKIPGVRYVSDFFTPIVFCGKVVDEKSNPVPSADVVASFANNPGEGGADNKFETDSHGRFWTWGVGLGVVIDVSKTGYYRLDKSGGSFCYNGDGGKVDRHISPADPAVFVLRKMGQTEPIVMIHRYVKIPKDGTPTQMILATGKTYQVSNGDIQVEAWTHDEGILPNHHQPYDWKCKISVPGGGLQPRTGGEFDFTAPETGYQPTDEIDMPANAPQWRERAARAYFLQLQNGTYARIDFEMIAGGDHFFQITSYLNPQPGHRNLESNAQ